MDCSERKRDQRNCYNRHQLSVDLLQGAEEWQQVPGSLRHVLKLGDIKYFQCPVSLITPYSTSLLQLVTDTINADGDLLPLCDGHPALLEIAQRPNAWREAVRIVKIERAEHRKQELERSRNGS